MTQPQLIKGDEPYDVEVTCPNCGESAYVGAHIAARVERTRSAGKIGLKVSQTKVDHKCGQTSMTIVSELDIDGGGQR